MTTHIKTPLPATCYICSTQFQINYSQFHKQYYQKNNLDYWTEKETDKNKHICSPCLRNLYYNQKWKYLVELITNPRKRQQLRIYLSKGTI